MRTVKRIYKTVAVHDTGKGFEIYLDGRPARMPSGSFLSAPSQALAQAVAGEWDAQGKDILPDTMPLTQILTTALDRVAAERQNMMRPLMAYLDTDLLCYRTVQPAIAQRQSAVWDPWLDWFHAAYQISLHITSDLQALRQPERAHDIMRFVLNEMDLYKFTITQMITDLTGSIVLGMAFTDGAITPDQVFAAANVDEIYKSEIYNEDFYGVAPNQQKRNEAMRRELKAAQEFLDLYSQ
jgi:chaperone required for assembly of F1-ATPase